jgi:hypothetical protein
MIERVILRLGDLGYVVQNTERSALEHVIDTTCNYIKSFCNISAIPEGLELTTIDMAAGNFLYEKKTTDADSLADFDTTAAISQISEGDTSVSYALTEKGSSIDMLISRLTDAAEVLHRWRRITW